jgi:uncharacterized membrane protein
MGDEVIKDIAVGVNTTTFSVAGGTVFLGLNVAEWGIIATIVGIVATLGMAAFTVWFRMKYQRND